MREALSETLAAALRQADTDARALNQEFVGTEHLLLGLLSATGGDALHALKSAADPAILRAELTKSLPKGDEPPLVTGRLPLSPKAQRIINTAIAAAQAAGESSVSSRFMLLALLEEPQSAVISALRSTGADIDHLTRLLQNRPSEREH
jgi:ATP-dependent Clp protease ATP-binding subunit ClpC